MSLKDDAASIFDFLFSADTPPVEKEVEKPVEPFEPCKSSSCFTIGLIAALKNKGLTIDYLSAREGLDGSGVSRFVKGETDWPLPTMEIIAGMLNTTVSGLITNGEAKMERDLRRVKLAVVVAEKEQVRARWMALCDEEKMLQKPVK